MYELKKKIEKVVTSKFAWPEPSSFKKNLPGCVLTKVEKQCSRPALGISNSKLDESSAVRIGIFLVFLIFSRKISEHNLNYAVKLPYNPFHVIMH